MEFRWEPDVTVARYSPRQVRQARDWLEEHGSHGRWQHLTARLLERAHATSFGAAERVRAVFSSCQMCRRNSAKRGSLRT